MEYCERWEAGNIGIILNFGRFEGSLVYQIACWLSIVIINWNPECGKWWVIWSNDILGRASLCKLLLLNCHLHNSVLPCQSLCCSSLFSTRWSLLIFWCRVPPGLWIPRTQCRGRKLVWTLSSACLFIVLCQCLCEVVSATPKIPRVEATHETSSGGVEACCSWGRLCPHPANSTFPRLPYFQHKPSLSRKQSMAIKVTKPIFILIWRYA